MDILYKILLLWVILLFFYFIGVNRTLHGRLEIRILSCRIHLISHSFVTQTREISFYNNRAKSRNLIGSQPLSIRGQTHRMTNRSRTKPARAWNGHFFQSFSLFWVFFDFVYCKKQIADGFELSVLLLTHSWRHKMSKTQVESRAQRVISLQSFEHIMTSRVCQ